MIHGRITSKSQTTVPRAVRTALGLEPGDTVAWEIEGDRVVVSRVNAGEDPFVNAFAMFTEWSDPLDDAYDAL